MELNNKYRAYKDRIQDDGREVFASLTKNFSPDFYNRNTIQLWDISAISEVNIEKWVGATLTDRTVHEITIVNNSNSTRNVTFVGTYLLPDNAEEQINSIAIGAQGTAYFYATAGLVNGNLFLTLRTGSQDNRKI